MSDNQHDFISPADRADIERLREDMKVPRSVAAPWLCRLRFHLWSKWWTANEGKIVSGETYVGMYTEQQRCCLKCYQVEYIEVKS